LLSLPRRPDDASQLGTQVVRFASIGVVSTVVFAAWFAVLVDPLGAIAADVVAFGLCAFANTAANRRLTFALRGRTGRVRQYSAGLAVAVMPLVLTLIVLGVLDAAGATSLGAQLLALTVTNAVATLGRFVVLRNWVFRA
jgi:putative flippase GtrA